MGTMYSGNINVDYANDTVDIAEHDGSAKGLKLGGTLVTATAAELNKLDGVTSTVAEINLVDNIFANATIAYAAGNSTDELNATITVKDAAGATIAAVHCLEVWISDDADGTGLTATAASGALTAETGVILTALTAKKHIIATTAATGILVLSLVDSANTVGERVVVKNPVNGKIIVGAATAATDYEGGA